VRDVASALMITAECDVLRDEGEVYVSKLRARRCCSDGDGRRPDRMVGERRLALAGPALPAHRGREERS
jgi:hypothetical protein